MKKAKVVSDFERLQKLSAFLSNIKTKNKLRYRHLATHSGLARCSVSKIIRGKQDITFTTLLKLIDAMDVEITFKEKLK